MKAWTREKEPGPAFLIFVLVLGFQNVRAAPLDEQSTEIDYYPVADATGCYYNFEHYNEGDRIITNEPCLNCTCHNKMLMCYLRVCPFTKAIGQDCRVEKRPDQCCPVITCPEVHIPLAHHPEESATTSLGHLNQYGCSIDNLFYADGAKVPSNPNNPCEVCYCIRNKTACIIQECTLTGKVVEGCRPVYVDGVCCPLRYDCDHPELETTPRPLLTTTTTTLAPTTLAPTDCIYNHESYSDGSLVKKDVPCEQCYCMRGDIVCAVQECGPTPLDKVNCTAMPTKEGQCCPDTYDCEQISEEDLTTLSNYEPPTTQPTIIKLEEGITVPEEVGEKTEATEGPKVDMIDRGTLTIDKAPVSESEEEKKETVTESVTSRITEAVTTRVTEIMETVTSAIFSGTETLTEKEQPPTEKAITEQPEVLTEGPENEPITQTPLSQEKIPVKEQETKAPEVQTSPSVPEPIVTTESQHEEQYTVSEESPAHDEQPGEPEIEEHTQQTDQPKKTEQPEKPDQPLTESPVTLPAEEEKETEAPTHKPAVTEEEVGEKTEATEGPKVIMSDRGTLTIVKEPASESEEEKKVTVTESVTNRITEAVTTRVTEIMETITSAIFSGTETNGITKGPTVPETVPTEAAVPEETTASVEVEKVQPTAETITEKPATEKPEKTEYAQGITEKQEEEMEIITSSPTGETDRPQSMDHVSETVSPQKEQSPEVTQAEQTTKSTPKETNKDEAPESTSQPQKEEESNEIPGDIEKCADEKCTLQGQTPPPETNIIPEVPVTCEDKESCGSTAEQATTATVPEEGEQTTPESNIIPEGPVQTSIEPQLPEKPISALCDNGEECPTGDTEEEKKISRTTIAPHTLTEKETEQPSEQSTESHEILESQSPTVSIEETEYPTEKPSEQVPETEKSVEEATEILETPAVTSPESVQPYTEKPEAVETQGPGEIIPETTSREGLSEQTEQAPKGSSEITEKPSAVTEQIIPETTQEPQTPHKPEFDETENEIPREEESATPSPEKGMPSVPVTEVQPYEKEATPEIIVSTHIPEVEETETTETSPEAPASVKPAEPSEQLPSASTEIPEIKPGEGVTSAPEKPAPTKEGSEQITAPEPTTLRATEESVSTDEPVTKIPAISQEAEPAETETVPPREEEASPESAAPETVTEPAVTETSKIQTEGPAETEGTPTVPPAAEEPTTEEHGIPGEGSCLVDGQTYRNNSVVPPINQCQVACRCVSSILQCKSIACDPPPSNLQDCTPIFQTPESCCPTYTCSSPGVTSMESDNQIVEASTPTREETPATTSPEIELTKPAQETKEPLEKTTSPSTPEITGVVTSEEHATEPEEKKETVTEASQVPTEEVKGTGEPSAETTIGITGEPTSSPSSEETKPVVITTESQRETTDQEHPIPEHDESENEITEKPIVPEKCGPEGCAAVPVEKDTQPPEKVPEDCGAEGCLPVSPTKDCGEEDCAPLQPIEGEKTTEQDCGTEGCTPTEAPQAPVPCDSDDCILVATTEKPSEECKEQGCVPAETPLVPEKCEDEKCTPVRPEEGCGAEGCEPISPTSQECGAEGCKLPSPIPEECGKEGCAPGTILPSEPSQTAEGCGSDGCAPPITTEEGKAPEEPPKAEECGDAGCAPTATDQPQTSGDCGETECVPTAPEPPQTAEGCDETECAPTAPEQPKEQCGADGCVPALPAQECGSEGCLPAPECEDAECIPAPVGSVTEPPAEESDQQTEKEYTGVTSEEPIRPSEDHIKETVEHSTEAEIEVMSPETEASVPVIPKETETARPTITEPAPEAETEGLTKSPEESANIPEIEEVATTPTLLPEEVSEIITKASTEATQVTKEEVTKQTSEEPSSATEKLEEIPERATEGLNVQSVQTFETEIPSSMTTKSPEAQTETAEHITETLEQISRKPIESADHVTEAQETEPPLEGPSATEATRPTVEAGTTERSEPVTEKEQAETESVEKSKPSEIQPTKETSAEEVKPTESTTLEEKSTEYRQPEEKVTESPEEKPIEGEEVTKVKPTEEPVEKVTPTEITKLEQESTEGTATAEIEEGRPTLQPIPSETNEPIKGAVTTDAISRPEGETVSQEEHVTPSIHEENIETEKPKVPETTTFTSQEGKVPTEEKTETAPETPTEAPATVGEFPTHAIEMETKLEVTTSAIESQSSTEGVTTAVIFVDRSKPVTPLPPAKEEEGFTPPELTTLPPKNESTLYTSGPQETLPTRQTAEGELSTSVPVPVATAEPQTTTQAATEAPTAPHDIPGEQVPELPDYQAPQEDYEEEDQSPLGPGTCRYGGKVYVSAQQIPRDDPCDFCFCFRSDIICLQQSCPPPIPNCHEEPIRGFCCPRYECPVSMVTSLNLTTSTTTTTTTLPPHFMSHAYKGRARKTGCQIQGQAYQVGEVIKSASGPCMHCTCGGDGQMKCDPKACSPEPMLRQMIAAAASRRRR